jgi:8-oxo-dGTP diphosphatase
MSTSGNFCYEYPRPALTVDAAVFTFVDKELKILLIKRGDEPYKEKWAFPGGFVNENETVEDAAKRELKEETAITDLQMEQFYTASAPGRDPRGWTVSVVFIGFTSEQSFNLKAGDDAAETAWHSVNTLPTLAFDHDELLKRALDTARNKMRFISIADTLLPETFSKDQLLLLGKLLNYSDSDINQRFQRFLRVGLLIGAGENNMYYFNRDRIKQIS